MTYPRDLVGYGSTPPDPEYKHTLGKRKSKRPPSPLADAYAKAAAESANLNLNEIPPPEGLLELNKRT